MKNRWLLISVLLASAPAFGQATFSSYLVKNTKDLTALKKEINKPGKSKDEKAWLRWQYALNAPQMDHITDALKVLGDLAGSKQSVIGQDHISLTKGRLLFQKGKFDDAVEAYQQVPKASEYWFEAMEEEAWSYIRLNEPDRATAKLATLMTPIFQTWVGPESFFASNYNSLKICDYSKILKNGKLFKERHGTRISELEKLKDTGANSQSATALARLETGEMKFMAFAKEAPSLPRFFWRDEFLRGHVKAIQALKKAGNDASTQKTRVKIIDRMKALAKAELSEYSTVIQKLQIIEAEVIQRLYLDESLKGDRPPMQKISTDANTLTFKHDDDAQAGELWADEIDRLQATVKTCPQMKEAKL